MVVSNDVAATEFVDCQGHTILPAFIDGHSHPTIAAKESLGPDVTHCQTVSQVATAIGEWVKLNDDAKWAIGGAYDRSMAPNAVFQAAWLDGISIPVVLHSNDHGY
jgi:predicted amidohydrolase YtcJ